MHVIDLSPNRSMDAFRKKTASLLFPPTGHSSSALELVAGGNLYLNVIGREVRTACGKMV